MVSLAQESFALAANLESYYDAGDISIFLLDEIYNRTDNILISYAASKMLYKMKSDYDQILIQGVGELAIKRVASMLLPGVDEILEKLFGPGPVIGIAAGNAVSNVWFDTDTQKKRIRQIWCIDNVADVFVSVVNNLEREFENTPDGTAEQAKIAEKLIYSTKALYVMRRSGEESLYELKQSVYHCSVVESIAWIFDILTSDKTWWEEDLDAVESWYNDVNDILDSIEYNLFGYIDPSRYLIDEPEDDSSDDTPPSVEPDPPVLSSVSLAQFNSRLKSFKKERYANGSTYIDNPKKTGGYQCFGFANELALYIFGSYPTNSMAANTVNKGWTRTYGGKAVDNLCVGDIVRYGYHSIFITGIDGDTITYCQANVPMGTNLVMYNQKIDRSRLAEKVSRKLTSPNTNKTGWVAHCNKSKAESVPVLNIRYHSNGGTIVAPEQIGATYRVITSSGLNVRASASENADKLGSLTKGTSVTVTKTKSAGGRTWGQITYKNKNGWIALDSSFAEKVGSSDTHDYYVDSSYMIYRNSTQRIYEQKCTYNVEVPKGFTNGIATFKLEREGYTFAGWSLKQTGGETLSDKKSFYPEQIVPELKDGSRTVTLYAVWEKNPPAPTEHTIESIYVSNVPSKRVYKVGDSLTDADIELAVKHINGYVETKTEGFVCYPSIFFMEGKQEVEVIYQGVSTTFTVYVTGDKSRANNATAKKDSTGYLMPSTSAATLKDQGVWAKDKLQVLCKDGDFYLCLIPWGDTSANKKNGVLLYIKAKDITVTGYVPNASEYYTLNPTGVNNAVINSDTKLYYRPDGGKNPVEYGGKTVAAKSISANTGVRVLFEMDGYYCIQTSKYTGFVAKDKLTFEPILCGISTSKTLIETEIGEAIDISDIAVNGIFSDGSVKAIDGASVVIPDTDSAGRKYIFISYGEFTSYIQVNVREDGELPPDPPMISVDNIYVSSLPEKTLYSIGDILSLEGLKIAVEYSDGSMAYKTSGFGCDTVTLNTEGSCIISVTYGARVTSFTVSVTKEKTRSNNATAIKDSVGYLLPNSSASTLKGQGVWAGDKLQVLCKDGDYYLCLIPWGGTTTDKKNGVLLYIKASDITVTGTVPSAADYYTMNLDGSYNATVISDTKLYYKPDGGENKVMYNNTEIPPKLITADTPIRVLFKMNGYLCVQTDKYTGFAAESAVKRNGVISAIGVESPYVEIYEGDEIDIADIVVKAYYSDGGVQLLNNAQIQLPDFASTGIKYVTVSYGGLFAYVEVNVLENPVTKISVEGDPKKLIYSIGDIFDPTGIAMTATYANGDIIDITNSPCVIYSYSFDESGNTVVEIIFEEASAYIPVVVYKEPELEISGTEGFVGQTLSIPVLYYYSNALISPDNLKLVLTYDPQRLEYTGKYTDSVTEGASLTVNASEEGKLEIIYEGVNLIGADRVLSVLDFDIKASDTNESTILEIDSFELCDSAGNSYSAVLTDGFALTKGRVSVTLYDNIDEDSSVVLTSRFGEEIVMPAETAKREGYIFAGWSESVDAYVSDYLPGERVNATEDMILYAVWISTDCHEYNDEGICDRCGSSLAISAGTLSLDQDISIRFIVREEVLSGYDYYRVSAVFDGDSYTLKPTVLYRNGVEHRVFTFYHIDPTLMGEKVYATLEVSRDGNSWISAQTIEYSIADYCYNMLRKSGTSATLKRLLVDLLNYGAASETYFKTADRLINADLTSEERALGTTAHKSYTDSFSISGKNNSLIRWHAATLNVNTSITPKIYFELLSGVDVTALTATVTVGTVTFDVSDFTKVRRNGKVYYVLSISGLNILDLNNPITVSITNGTRSSAKLTYSIESFAVRQSDNENRVLANLADSMVKYIKSADEYFNK